MKSNTQSVQVAMRLAPAEKREIARAARRIRLTLSEFARMAIREKLAADAAKKPTNGGERAA